MMGKSTEKWAMGTRIEERRHTDTKTHRHRQADRHTVYADTQTHRYHTVSCSILSID